EMAPSGSRRSPQRGLRALKFADESRRRPASPGSAKIPKHPIGHLTPCARRGSYDLQTAESSKAFECLTGAVATPRRDIAAPPPGRPRPLRRDIAAPSLGRE